MRLTLLNLIWFAGHWPSYREPRQSALMAPFKADRHTYLLELTHSDAWE